MALNKNKKIATLDDLRKLTQNVKDYNSLQDAILKSDINLNKISIEEEISRAQIEEKRIESSLIDLISKESNRAQSSEQEIENSLNEKINEEKIRAQSEEQLLNNKISEEISRAQEAEKNLQSNIDNASSEYKNLINNLEDKHNSELSSLSTKHDNDLFVLEANTNATIANTKADIWSNVDNVIGNKISPLEQKVDEVQNSNSNISLSLRDHIGNSLNPHNVTPDQIGAIKKGDLDPLNIKVDTLKEESINIKNRLDSAETNINNSQSNISQIIEDVNDLKSNKLNTSGNNQTLTGDLTLKKTETSTGNLIVEGELTSYNDLTVRGNLNVIGQTITTTVENQTLGVKDNFIIINSDGTKIETLLSGVAIKTDEQDAYGIAYDPVNKSVSLGTGVVDENNNFQFNSNENKPILTRAQSNDLEDGHILVWDSETNTAIDGGEFSIPQLEKNFVTWAAHTELTESLGRAKETLSNDIDNLKNIKQNKEDSNLETEDKLITGAINEVHQELNNLNQVTLNHISHYNNPHDVTWNQINTSNGVYSDAIPYRDGINPSDGSYSGEGSAGTQTSVSRSDHIHPTDISRAPVEHTSNLPTYGQATDTLYGHVKVDSSISDISENPVQNKIVKKYVDDSIAGLDVSALSVSANETISSISETDGKIAVAKQPIQINKDQVNELSNSLSALEQQDIALQQNIDKVQENLNSVQKEFQNNLNNSESTLNNNIDNLRNDLIDAKQSLEEDIEKSKDELTGIIDEKSKSLDQSIQQEAQNRSGADTELAAQINNTNYNLTNLSNRLEDIVAFYNSLKSLSDKEKIYSIGFDQNGNPKATTLDDGLLM